MRKVHSCLLTLVGVFSLCRSYAAVNIQPNVLDDEWTIVITGGHETDVRDHGRPVVLVAGGLGVKPEVFREAFSHVRPVPSGERPTEQRAQENKRALLDALGKYGVTNERLDEVSNYYRYRPENRELWKTRSATAKVVLTKGHFTSIKIEDAGAGYSSAPNVKVVGHPEMKLIAVLSFSKDLSKNGSISEIKVPKP